MPTMDTLAQVYAARRRQGEGPPGSGATGYMIPGVGTYRRKRNRLRYLHNKRPVPGGYQPGGRGQTKPTPGSYYGRQQPTQN
jgi:hypothetical protein